MMRQIHIPYKVRPFLALIAVVLCMSVLTGFQSNNGSITDSEIAFNAVTTTGPSAPFRNFGLASHWLTYCPVNAATISIELEASQDNVTWFAISPPGTTVSGCSTLEGGGYFNYVRANLLILTGGVSSVTAYYGGSSYAISVGGIGQQGKSSQTTTMVAAVNTFVNGGCGAPATIISGQTVVYGFTVYNPNAAPIFFNMSDTGSGDSGVMTRGVVAGTSSKEINFPTVGVQAGTALKLSLCTASDFTGEPVFPFPSASVYYKTNPIISAKANGAGVVSSTRPSQP